MKGYVPWSGTKFYHSIYCSLATQIGQQFGYPFRVVISFEMVLLAVLMFAVHAEIWSENKPIPKSEWFVDRKCCLPGLVRPMAPQTHLLDPLAGLSMLFVEFNIIDKIRDGGGNGWRILRYLLKRRFRKASYLSSAWFGDQLIEELRELIFRQGPAEKLVSRGGDLELCWNATASASRILFEAIHPNLAALGEIVGLLLYSCDAIDDYPDDLIRGVFNPFLIDRDKTFFLIQGQMTALGEVLNGDSLNFLPYLALKEIKAILTPWEGRIRYLAYTKGLHFEVGVVPERPSSWWFDEVRSKCQNCRCCAIL